MAGPPAIGIDIGTSYSSVGVYRNGGFEIIINSNGNSSTPSYVAFTDNEQVVGDAAKNQVPMNPVNTIYGAKRLIGRKLEDSTVRESMWRWPFAIDSNRGKPVVLVNNEGKTATFTPEEISSFLLKKLKLFAETHLGESVSEAVISVPASFTNSQRIATMNAAALAGLKVLRLINEPTAAALVYGHDKYVGINAKENLLMFNFGGGFLDVSVVCVKDQVYELKSTAGLQLGGEDIDDAMVTHMIEVFVRNGGESNITNDKSAICRLRIACERAKILLSTTNEAIVHIENLHGGCDLLTTITRLQFEDWNGHHFNKIMQPVIKALEEAVLTKYDVTRVLLVGGSSQIPKVKEMLSLFFGRNELLMTMTDEAVTSGAAFQAFTLQHGLCDKVLEVTPNSIGVEVEGGMMNVIMDRDIGIPYSISQTFTTKGENQREILMKLYEGESSIAMENKLTGNFVIRNIPYAPAGVPLIDVTFYINSNGILEVNASTTSNLRDYQLPVTSDQSIWSTIKTNVINSPKPAPHVDVEDEEENSDGEVSAYDSEEDDECRSEDESPPSKKGKLSSIHKCKVWTKVEGEKVMCSYETSDTEDFLDHGRYAHGEIWDLCFREPCNGSVQRNVGGHYLMHEGDKQCYFCDRSFSTYNVMMNHLLIEHRGPMGLIELEEEMKFEQNGDVDLESKLYELCEDAPFLRDPDRYKILKRGCFIVVYDLVKLRTILVLQYLDPEKLNGKRLPTIRTHKYFRDRGLPLNQQTVKAIRRLNMICGHLASSADYADSKDDRKDADVLSNIVAMIPGFNNGIWYSLETTMRSIGKSYSTGMYLFTFVVYDDDSKPPVDYLGVKVSIPFSLGKVSYINRGNETFGQAFLMEHKEKSEGNNCFHRSFRKSFEEISAASGVTFKPVPLTWESAEYEKVHTCKIQPKICKKTFKSKVELDTHQLEHEGKYYCCHCTELFSSQKERIEHKHQVHFRFPCPHCKFTSFCTTILEKHLVIHTGEKPYKCHICTKAFAHENSLKEHLKTHTGEKPYECNKCDKAFAAQSNLLSHQRLHNGEKPHSCNICNRKFARKHSLILHLRTHSGEKPFKCIFCEHACAREADLISHLRRHTGEKPFFCSVCKKGFAGKNDLRQHEGSHLAKKPHQCKICDKSFAQKSKLTRHEQTHTRPERPNTRTGEKRQVIIVPQCDLTVHERIHTGERPFGCSYCDMAFRAKSDKTKHERRMHKEDDVKKGNGDEKGKGEKKPNAPRKSRK